MGCWLPFAGNPGFVTTLGSWEYEMSTEDKGTLVVLAERRKHQLEGTEWTPREALLSMIQDIEDGLDIDQLVICYDGIRGSGFKNATSSARDAIGLLQVTQLEIYTRGREE